MVTLVVVLGDLIFQFSTTRNLPFFLGASFMGWIGTVMLLIPFLHVR